LFKPGERAFKQFKCPHPQCVKKKPGYWKLKDNALDRTLWRNCFGRGYGPWM